MIQTTTSYFKPYKINNKSKSNSIPPHPTSSNTLKAKFPLNTFFSSSNKHK